MQPAVAKKVNGVVMTSSAGADAEGHEGGEDGVGAGGEGDDVGRCEELAEVFFEAADEGAGGGAGGVLLGFEDFLEGGFDFVADELPLGGEFEKRDGGGGRWCGLGHDGTSCERVHITGAGGESKTGGDCLSPVAELTSEAAGDGKGTRVFWGEN